MRGEGFALEIADEIGRFELQKYTWYTVVVGPTRGGMHKAATRDKAVKPAVTTETLNRAATVLYRAGVYIGRYPNHLGRIPPYSRSILASTSSVQKFALLPLLGDYEPHPTAAAVASAVAAAAAAVRTLVPLEHNELWG